MIGVWFNIDIKNLVLISQVPRLYNARLVVRKEIPPDCPLPRISTPDCISAAIYLAFPDILSSALYFNGPTLANESTSDFPPAPGLRLVAGCCSLPTPYETGALLLKASCDSCSAASEYPSSFLLPMFARPQYGPKYGSVCRC